MFGDRRALPSLFVHEGCATDGESLEVKFFAMNGYGTGIANFANFWERIEESLFPPVLDIGEFVTTDLSRARRSERGE